MTTDCRYCISSEGNLNLSYLSQCSTRRHVSLLPLLMGESRLPYLVPSSPETSSLHTEPSVPRPALSSEILAGFLEDVHPWFWLVLVGDSPPPNFNLRVERAVQVATRNSRKGQMLVPIATSASPSVQRRSTVAIRSSVGNTSLFLHTPTDLLI